MRKMKWTTAAVALSLVAACNQQAAQQADVSSVDTNVSEVDAATAAPAANDKIFCAVVDARISKSDCDDLKAVESQVTRGVAAFNVPNPMTRDEPKAITLVVDRRHPEEIARIEEAENAMTVEAELAAENMVDEANLATNEVSAGANETSVDFRNKPAMADGNPPSGGPSPSSAGPTPSEIVDPLEGETARLTPKVGRFMSADLRGDGFEIEALSPPSQEIPPGEQAVWQWNVIPTQGGAHSLTLKTVVEGEVGGKRYPLSRTQTVKTVKVEVSWPGWAKDKISQLTRGLTILQGLLLAMGAVLVAALGIWRPWKNRNKD